MKGRTRRLRRHGATTNTVVARSAFMKRTHNAAGKRTKCTRFHNVPFFRIAFLEQAKKNSTLKNRIEFTAYHLENPSGPNIAGTPIAAEHIGNGHARTGTSLKHLAVANIDPDMGGTRFIRFKKDQVTGLKVPGRNLWITVILGIR